MPPDGEVIIVGGGAIGAACARELAAAGRRVLVIEPGGDLGQAWRAAGGMLAPQIEAGPDDPALELGLAARDQYPALAAALQKHTGIDIGLWREGVARVAIDATDAAELRAKVAWQRQQGYACEWLESPEMRRRWPWLGPAVGALWAPHEAALDPRELVRALLADAQRMGASLICDRIVEVEETGGRVTGVRGEAGPYSAPDVVLAAGAWSGQIKGLPRKLPVQPVRGQMAAVPWPSGMARAIVYNKDSYLLAREDEAILGSTMEYVGFHPEVTSEGLARIFAATLAICPGLLRAKLRRSWAGLRPLTPDGLPIIGAEPELPGLWYATGHGRNGILLAGITGKLMTQLLGGTQPRLDLEPFSPQRFGAR